MLRQEKRGNRKRKDTTLLTLSVVLLLFSLLLLAERELGISQLTGHAIYGTKQEVKIELEELLQSFPLTRFVGEGSSICLFIEVSPGIIYSYDIAKMDGRLVVSPSNNWNCDGTEGEDFILKYVSYDAFLEHKNNPTCNAFLSNGRGQNFWYLPSRLWPEGRNMFYCNEEFQEKYCPAIYYCTDPEKAPVPIALECCSRSNLDAQQLLQAQQAAEQGLAENARGKSAVLRSPFFDYLKPLLFWTFGIVIILLLLFTSLRLMKKPGKKRSEAMQMLQSYVENTLEAGFSEKQIREELKSKGWPEHIVEDVFQVVRR